MDFGVLKICFQCFDLSDEMLESRDIVPVDIAWDQLTTPLGCDARPFQGISAVC